MGEENAPETKTVQEVSEEKPAQSEEKLRSSRGRNIALFLLIAVGWLIFDRLTKAYFDANYSIGEAITEPIMGLFRFLLVHNTGAAWGMFDQSTLALGVMATVVCVAIIGFFVWMSARANLAEVMGLALVFAGGLGNVIDRFSIGYVVDFIDFTFISFPVFNIADIGVTCGFILFILGMFYSWMKEDKARKQEKESADAKDVAKIGESTKKPESE